jgi:PAS domain S-box-containing protein
MDRPRPPVVTPPSVPLGTTESEQMAARWLNESPDGEAWLDAQGRLTWLNTAAERMTGQTIPACLGHPDFAASIVFPADHDLLRTLRDQAQVERLPAQAHLRLIRNDQSIIWASLSWQPLWSAEGHVLSVRMSLRDSSLAARTASSPRDQLVALRRQAQRITREASRMNLDLEGLCHHIATESAQLLRLSRVGIWLFSADRAWLRCVSMSVAGQAATADHSQIAWCDFPVYMQAISTDELVVATHACQHPLTAELANSYLRPLGIASLLDAPIQQCGQTVGVLCMEHGPGERQWSAAEASFADALATAVGQHLEAQERERLQTLGQRQVSIIETTPDLVFTATLSGDLLYLNHAGRQLLGVTDEACIESFNAMDYVPPELRERRRQEIIPHTLKHGHWSGEVLMLTPRGERIPAWEYFLAHRDAKGRVQYFSAVMRDLREQKRTERELRQREAALTQLNAELERRVADRTRQIEDINRNLETFAFSVSHDLKAPLRGIDGYSRLLMEDYRAQLPQEAQDFVDNIRQATQNMSQLIDDLLTYSRVGRRELSASRFSLRSTVLRVLSERAHDLQEHHVRVIETIPELDITADLECLLQILRNLIDNAVKFMRHTPEPTLSLSLARKPRHLVFSVKDNGSGFDMKYHDRIFAIFQRLHLATDYPGTGVGLAIVSKAAERLGGRVWAQSAPGQGAEFFLELPDQEACDEH